MKLEVQGVERRFFAVPPKTRVAGAMPVLVGYHGGGLGADNAADWGFTVDQQGKDGGGKAVLGLYPWGLTQSNGFTGWDDGQEGSADVELTEAMLGWAAANYCIDDSRVYAAGHSWGGWMATRIGCVRPMLFRAVMSLGGGGPAPSTDCKTPVAALIVHGTEDTIANESDSRDSLASFRKINGCSEVSTPKNAEQVQCDLFAACQNASEPVGWCWYKGGHFPWPMSIVEPAWSWFETLP